MSIRKLAQSHGYHFLTRADEERMKMFLRDVMEEKTSNQV